MCKLRLLMAIGVLLLLRINIYAQESQKMYLSFDKNLKGGYNTLHLIKLEIWNSKGHLEDMSIQINQEYLQ